MPPWKPTRLWWRVSAARVDGNDRGGSFLADSHLVTWTPDILELRDVSSGRVAWQNEVSSYTQSISLSPDGSLLALGGGEYGSRWDGRVRVTDVRDGRSLWERRGFRTATFAPSGDALILGSVGAEEPTTVERVDSRTAHAA